MFVSFIKSLQLSDSEEAQTHRTGIAEGDGRVFVLDGYAVRTVVTMGALDLQSNVFITATIAQVTMDDLRRLGDQITPRPAPPPEADAPKVCLETEADGQHQVAR